MMLRRMADDNREFLTLEAKRMPTDADYEYQRNNKGRSRGTTGNVVVGDTLPRTTDNRGSNDDLVEVRPFTQNVHCVLRGNNIF